MRSASYICDAEFLTDLVDSETFGTAHGFSSLEKLRRMLIWRVLELILGWKVQSSACFSYSYEFLS